MNKFLWKVENGCLDYTPITTIENAITQKQAQEISQQILEFSKTEFSKQHEKFATDNNPGCWRGFALEAPDDVPGLSKENKKLIVDTIQEAGKMYMESWQQPTNFYKATWHTEPFDFFNNMDMDIHVWFNINNKGAANMIHNHHGALFSGVFYFQAEDTGPFRMYPDNYIVGYTHPCWPYKGTSFHYPKDGDMLLFPSYLSHDVPENPIDKQRINCAFNVSPRPKMPQG